MNGNTPALDEGNAARWSRWWEAAEERAIDEALRGLIDAVDGAVANPVAFDGATTPLERSPRCDASGRCCDFNAYGHRLYVTGLEIAWSLRQILGDVASGDVATRVGGLSGDLGSGKDDSLNAAAGAIRLPVVENTTDESSDGIEALWRGEGEIDLALPCVFQVAKRCTVHAHRPMGCRLYFCEPGTDAWQHETYEYFQSQVRKIHQSHGVPYEYMEWRHGLREAIPAVRERMERHRGR